jgi:hypothetical protein
MKSSFDPDQLQGSYRNELIRAGVSPQKAEQAAKTMSNQDLMLIGEIWGQWAVFLAKT